MEEEGVYYSGLSSNIGGNEIRWEVVCKPSMTFLDSFQKWGWIYI